MPIRMEKDPQRPDENRDPKPPRPPRPRRGGGGLMNFLPLILGFLFKKPKLLIFVLVVGALLYFLGFFGPATGVGEDDGYTDNQRTFSFGATLDETVYDKAEVFEPLAEGHGNTLPPAVSLEKYAPKRLHQGRQGSCVGWASSYAARTILYARQTGKNPNDVAFSPASLYNQIALEGCQGAYMKDAMEVMRTRGVLPFREFGYDDRSCANLPSRAEMQEAQRYRIKGYNRLTYGAKNYKPDILAVKQNLAQGAPVVIGMQVGGSFMYEMRGKQVWHPNQRDYSLYGFSGHAMSVIGYDDNFDGGAFQLMNSWGSDWGENGLAWVRYRDFEYFVKEAYGLYPMGNSQKYDKNKLAVKFGLLDNETQKLIPLFEKGMGLFRTIKPIRTGQKFKVAITNSIEAYVYIFGMETDGSSYVLFPYTKQHSAYCGITGTRIFPKDYSLKADNLGTTDYIAVVVTKEAIDFNQANTLINQSNQRDYYRKVLETFASQHVENVKFKGGEAVEFACDLNGKNAVVTVLEIDKE